MADRLRALPWEPMDKTQSARLLMDRRTSRAVVSLPTIGRRLEWTVYPVDADEWRIGIGIVGEHGLHTVIAVAGDEASAKATARDLAHLAGQTW